jgi:hypothetical protein
MSSQLARPANYPTLGVARVRGETVRHYPTLGIAAMRAGPSIYKPPILSAVSPVVTYEN